MYLLKFVYFVIHLYKSDLLLVSKKKTKNSRIFINLFVFSNWTDVSYLY